MAAKQKQTLRAGTKIEMSGMQPFPGFPGVPAETAKICRWTLRNGPIPNEVRGNGGWHIVEFKDGGRLCVHESRFQVVQ